VPYFTITNGIKTQKNKAFNKAKRLPKYYTKGAKELLFPFFLSGMVK